MSRANSRLPFGVALLNGSHDRAAFDCGTPALNRYLAEQASQDIRRRVASCFLALDEAGRIAGYKTLAAASATLTDLPAAVAKMLPRHHAIPTVRMGRSLPMPSWWMPRTTRPAPSTGTTASFPCQWPFWPCSCSWLACRRRPDTAGAVQAADRVRYASGQGQGITQPA